MVSILLDSSNTSLTVALASEGKVIDSISYLAWQTQSEHMIPELDNILTRNNISRHDIEDVIVSIGPGSYTGVRIALTIAKVIGVALSCPIYPVSSLRVLMDTTLPSICVINARSNRSYIGVYHQDKVIVSDTIMTNDEVKAYIANHPDYVLCGDSKYLGIEGKENSIASSMAYLKPFLSPIEDNLGLKPIYMKD